MASTKLQQIIALIDEANGEDPNRELAADSQQYPKELLYGERMSAKLAEFAPDASEVLRIAARGQHIRRWRIARDSYPKTRAGYLQWRRDLGKFHARETAKLMEIVGYDQQSIERVEDLLQKKQLKQDPEAQTLEDVICLVFLEHYLEDFARDHDEEKLIRILRKTWRKMCPAGREAALDIPLSDSMNALLEKALRE